MIMCATKEVQRVNSLAYIMVVLGILLAKGIGFFRDIVFASVFGASVYTDIYFQVFGLVNLIFTGVGVALSTLIIKNVNKNNNKPMTLIAKKEHVTVGALTTCVNRLVQKGYLLRTRDEMDQRVILLSVTQKGKKVLKVHDKFHDDIIGLTLENVNLAQATKVMTQFAHILEVYYDPTLLNVKEPAKKGQKKK